MQLFHCCCLFSAFEIPPDKFSDCSKQGKSCFFSDLDDLFMNFQKYILYFFWKSAIMIADSMLFCLKFLQINGRILRRNLHFIETKCHAEKMCFPSMAFFMVLDLFPDTLLACMRCVNFNFVYFWSYPDLFPHTEKGHLSYFSNILQKEKSAEKSALFHLLSLLPWHQYYALNVQRHFNFNVCIFVKLPIQPYWISNLNFSRK